LTRIASRASAPDRKAVFASLGRLYEDLSRGRASRGSIVNLDPERDRFIVFSDHHKGNRDAGDDFASNEKNYLAALGHYLQQGFHYICLGDGEELWKYRPAEVMAHNTRVLRAEALFHEVNRYTKTFGNHDLIWKNPWDVRFWFRGLFRLPLPVREGIVLACRLDNRPVSILLTHGHQGDRMSDNNGFSTWIVSHLWRPLQRYLAINVNTPATDFRLTDRHNIMMYEWSAQQENLLLITGHTHKPVFASGLYSDHPSNRIPGHNDTGTLPGRPPLRPSYFNSGCCCYNDGDITGIEIAQGSIRLVKWHWLDGASHRVVLEEKSLVELAREL